MDRSGREEHLVAEELGWCTVDDGADANGPGMCEQHTVDQDTAPDGEVGPAPGRFQVAVVAAHPHVVPGVVRQHADTGAVRGIAVRHPRIAEGHEAVTD